jgi:HPt (histidine-containing phosphotransfer) domain-containing protein
MTQPGDHSSHGPVNLAELLTRVENDRELLVELIGVFKEEYPPLLQSLRQSISCGDLLTVEATSHALKGMLSGLSITNAAAVASRLERLGRDGKTPELADAFTLLEREVADSVPELDAYIAETNP